MVHGSQTDVLVATPVAGDEVAVEQFIVVGIRQSIINTCQAILILGQQRASGVSRSGTVGDVVQKRVTGTTRQAGVNRTV
ncbi:hypothetical protein D3C85_1818990 [compost metagenome]